MQQSIRRTLNTQIGCVILIVNIIIGIIFYFLSVSMAEKDFKKKIELHTKHLSDAFSHQLWVLDLNAVKHLGNLAMDTPDIIGLRLTLTDNKIITIFEKGNFKSESSIFLKKDLLYNGTMPIGRMELSFANTSWKKQQKFIFFNGILMIGATILTTFLFISSLMDRHLVNPLENLQKDMISLTEGEFKQSAISGQKTEIQDIIDVFNRMSVSLARRDRALRQNEEKYRSLFENTGTATFVADNDMVITEVNDNCLSLIGYTKDEIVGKMKTIDFIPESELQRIQHYHTMRRKEKNSVPNQYELSIFHRNGQAINVVIQTGLIPGTQQSIASVIDITHLKNAENALRESEERYREIVEGTENLVTEVDAEGKFTFVNEASKKVFGLYPNECIGKVAFDFIHLDDREKTLQNFSQWIESGDSSATFENRQVSQTGHIRDMLWSIKIHYDRAGKVASLRSIARDITDRKKMEKALQISNERFQRIFKSEAIGIVLADLEGKIIEANDAFLLMIGYHREDLPLDWFTMTPLEWQEQDKLLIHQIRDSGIVPSFEKEYLRSDGSRVPVMIVGVQLKEEGGKVLCFILDQTERKKAAEELKQSEATRSSIFKAAPVGIGVVVERIITHVNDRLCNMTGYSSDELVGKSVRLLYPDSDEFDIVGKEKYNQIRKFGTGTVETVWQTKKGKKKNILLSSTPIKDEDLSAGVTFTALDITERKLAEEELKENEAKYRGLVEMFPHSVSISQDRKIVFANTTCAKMFGVNSFDDLIGRDVAKGLPDDEKHRLMDFVRRREKGDQNIPTHYEAIFQRDDGTTFTGDVIVSSIVYKGQPASQYIIMDITNRKKVEEELDQYRDHLEKLVEERTDKLTQTNKLLEAEIHERERAEKELRKYADTQAVLVQEVNHRVKNNLSAIIGMLHMEQDRAESEGMASYIPVLQDLVGRIGGLSTVHSLLSASGWRPLEISQLCKEVAHATLQGVPLEKTVHLEITPSHVRVNSNQAHHLTLVINELTTNTMKYALKGRKDAKIIIQITRKEDTIKIIFKDDGPGYPDTIFEKDFSPTSIGFELIRGITQRSLNGKVDFKNDSGAVTLITFQNEQNNT